MASQQQIIIKRADSVKVRRWLECPKCHLFTSLSKVYDTRTKRRVDICANNLCRYVDVVSYGKRKKEN